MNRLGFFVAGALFGGMIFRWLGGIVGGITRR
jgi:hypothetical protein